MTNFKMRNMTAMFLSLIMAVLMIAPAYGANKSVPPNYREYTQLQIGDILFDTPKAPRQKLQAARVYMVGKVAKSNLIKADEVILYRIIITCCVADGLPLGVLVKLPAKTAFKEGDWIGVEGTIRLQPFNEKLKSLEPLVNMVPPEKICPYFTASKTYKLKSPPDEYLYVGYSD